MSSKGEPASEHKGGETFPPTHWSVILSAAQRGSPEADVALARLCEGYWYPLYAFLRRRGSSPEQAEDLTQGYFDMLMRREVLAGLTMDGGRFRSFLLTTLKRFLANEWHREHAQKRGGGLVLRPLSAEAEDRFRFEPVDHATPETEYERQWAWTVLDRVGARVREEYSAAGKAGRFGRLEPALPGTAGEVDYAAAAAVLQTTEPALRMAAVRLRRRYGEMLRAEIAQTVTNPSEVDEEIRHLINVIGGS